MSLCARWQLYLDWSCLSCVVKPPEGVSLTRVWQRNCFPLVSCKAPIWLWNCHSSLLLEIVATAWLVLFWPCVVCVCVCVCVCSGGGPHGKTWWSLETPILEKGWFEDFGRCFYACGQILSQRLHHNCARYSHEALQVYSWLQNKDVVQFMKTEYLCNNVGIKTVYS